MYDFFIKLLSYAVNLNNMMFAPVDKLIGKLSLTPWLSDALKDSVHMLPFLFFIFLVIELIEYYFSDNMNKIVKNSQKSGPLAGSILASIPQCGFSVMASTLYTKRLITVGTLLAVYIATSDEAIPVLLANPSFAPVIFKILFIKIVIALIVGYGIDLGFCKTIKKADDKEPETEESGCCNHKVNTKRKKDLLFHPIAHSANIFVFILIVTAIINFAVMKAGSEAQLSRYLLQDSIFQPILTAIAGLVPNCAVSVAITMMYVKGALSFGSAIAGLTSGAGLGVLVLLKKNDSLKDSLKIIGTLLCVSIIAGILLHIFYR